MSALRRFRLKRFVVLAAVAVGIGIVLLNSQSIRPAPAPVDGWADLLLPASAGQAARTGHFTLLLEQPRYGLSRGTTAYSVFVCGVGAPLERFRAFLLLGGESRISESSMIGQAESFEVRNLRLQTNVMSFGPTGPVSVYAIDFADAPQCTRRTTPSTRSLDLDRRSGSLFRIREQASHWKTMTADLTDWGPYESISLPEVGRFTSGVMSTATDGPYHTGNRRLGDLTRPSDLTSVVNSGEIPVGTAIDTASPETVSNSRLVWVDEGSGIQPKAVLVDLTRLSRLTNALNVLNMIFGVLVAVALIPPYPAPGGELLDHSTAHHESRKQGLQTTRLRDHRPRSLATFVVLALAVWRILRGHRSSQSR